MYMALQASKCQSFSVIKTISAAVRQAHLIMGFPSPTLGIHPSLIRSAAQRELGVKVKNVKAPWQLSHLQSFCAEMCCSVASAPMWITGLMAYCSFATFGRFDCLQSIRWEQVDLSEGDQMVVSFEKRKNDQFREGSKVVVPCRDDALDLVSLMASWKERSPAGKEDDFVFLNFPFNANSRNLDAPVHTRQAISYGQYRKALSIWMPAHVGVQNASEFLKLYGTKSGRAGGATAACNAGVPDAVWQRHGGWRSDVKWRYVQPDRQSTQAVGMAILRPGSQPLPAPVAQISESAGPS
jgi:hypothetical protein